MPSSGEQLLALGGLTGGCVLVAVVLYKLLSRKRLSPAQLDIQNSNPLTKAHIKALWSRYDLDRTGHLQPHELKAVVSAFFKKLAVDQGLLVSYVMEVFRDHVGEDIKKASLGVLSCLLRDMEANSTCIFEELMDRLEKNKSGTIQRSEFVSLFSMWFEARLEAELTRQLS